MEPEITKKPDSVWGKRDTKTYKPRFYQGVLLDADEEVVTVVHRHPIGIVFIALGGVGAIIAIISLFIAVMPSVFDTAQGATNGASIILFIIGFMVFGVLLLAYIYRGSRLMITNKHLVQISQKTLFNRKVTRLIMSDVEDASADQRGILATIFNYGTMLIQTAGTTENFIFKNCPTPDIFAAQIIAAREQYADEFGAE